MFWFVSLQNELDMTSNHEHNFKSGQVLDHLVKMGVGDSLGCNLCPNMLMGPSVYQLLTLCLTSRPHNIFKSGLYHSYWVIGGFGMDLKHHVDHVWV